MKRLVVLVSLLAVAIVVGNTWDWKFVLAPLLGWAFVAWAFASLRSMAAGGTPAAVEGDNTPRPVTASERVLYWCEECGTELLLVVRGSGVIPRHCGARMHERVEVRGTR